MQLTRIKTSLLQGNIGQISGLPKNPRVIKNGDYKKLLESIKEDSELLEAKPLLVVEYQNRYIVIAGNQRLAACKELKIEEIPCAIVPDGTPVEKLRAYATKDNTHAGEWDFDLLANEWDVPELTKWGVDVPEMPDINAGEKPPKEKPAKTCPHCGKEI